MKHALWMVAILAVAPLGRAVAQDMLPVLPQNDVLPVSLEDILSRRDKIDRIDVVVDMGLRQDNPHWEMSATEKPIFLSRLANMPEKPLPIDSVWPQVKAPEPQYHGLTVLMRTFDGRRFAPLHVFAGKVEAPNSVVLVPDYGRNLEYWLFGTARVRRDQMLGATVLPVLTFDECRLLGQKIVYTTPRQCLLPDNNILLDTGSIPDVTAARVTTFDQCLLHGRALIYTFPRRCLTTGGRVFTEPPRVYENSQISATEARETFMDTRPMGVSAAGLLRNGISGTVATSASTPIGQ